MIFSCIIPASQKDAESQLLNDLIASIRSQEFPQDQIEILVVTNGNIKSEDIRRKDATYIWAEADSEQAKAMGIKHARGEICAMFCADNYITETNLFKRVHALISKGMTAVYPFWYHHESDDNSLNRYFSLIGGNDPVCYYLGKNDRLPHALELGRTSNYPPSYGCNGFFYRADAIKATNLDHYYPMDNALEVKGDITGIWSHGIWHRTSDNLLTFLKKRYRYARDLYSDRTDRRWRIIDTWEDRSNLILFILSTIFVFPCLYVSFKGFSKVKDLAWFWHWPVCFGFLITYTILAIRNLFKHGALFQRSPSLSRHSTVATS